ncbi:hypothetical protein J3459_008670 [Metarhizium acridum]|uniref:uncharacterized protein n=1 Tax=Metarhizium acridum TaxID=92637 RepID=UPI001C6AF33A|nr:hypothetical protein J3458_019350 [Metarhizium acridum]KAG8425880.1 hypothetical protein J3459_008670 [Metarhizium acridum]
MLGFGDQTISCGYHADDGFVYASGVRSTGLFKERKYGQGDTVGCGVDADKGVIYFTIGGQRLVGALHRPSGKLYPAVFFNTRETGVSISLERMSKRFGASKVKVEDD